MSKGTKWTDQDLLARGLRNDGSGIYTFIGQTLGKAVAAANDREKANSKIPQASPSGKVGIFEAALVHEGLPLPEREWFFHPTKRWRFDYAWPDYLVALEQEGGVFGHKKQDGTKSDKGAHSSISGILRDMHKYNEATCLGWQVIRVLPSDLTKLNTMKMLKQLLTK